jgi:hypothetical protein
MPRIFWKTQALTPTVSDGRSGSNAALDSKADRGGELDRIVLGPAVEQLIASQSKSMTAPPSSRASFGQCRRPHLSIED